MYALCISFPTHPYFVEPHHLVLLQEFAFCILLILWSGFDLRQEFSYIEYFAGMGNLTRCMKSAQYRSIRLDIKDHSPETKKNNYMDLASAAGMALAVIVLLKGLHDDFASHYGMKCSSLCKVNVVTSMRSACSSLGYTGHPSVMLTNKLLERMCALVLLTTCLGGAWTVEQPGGSLMEFFPTWRFVVQNLFRVGGPAAVSTVKWWMQHYKAPTAKRHYGYANSPVVRRLDRGTLQRTKHGSDQQKIQTCEKYYDGSGKLRYKGTRHLKGTEIYPMAFARAMVDMVEDLKAGAKGKPELPAQGAPPALYTMTQLEWNTPEDLWTFADFDQLFTYLRGSKRLRIPLEWRNVIPSKLKTG
ncbi:unnamed protein product [Cladocopium goreaui]|uniref:Uncharacterized protein n=1 Tax=Cladocopium goreaui TaxID=2562237 RepID=A0A9P1CSX9_9DINO|nr:unnamed protein product [Cladocopium goreaui]